MTNEQKDKRMTLEGVQTLVQDTARRFNSEVVGPLRSGKADKATTLAGYGIEDAYTKTEVNNLITTPNQGYVTVSATAQTTAATDVLPATGASDTVYRVANWDGTQYADSSYSEYAWDGTQYVFLCKKSQVEEVYDISVHNSNAKYANLEAALGTNGANVPQDIRKGGMSVKFVQSSDNKYIQARLMANAFTTDVSQWQVVDKELKINSTNLIENDCVAREADNINFNIGEKASSIILSPGYINDGVGVGTVVDLTAISHPTAGYAILNCSEGDVFYVQGISGEALRLYCFIDSQNKKISSSAASVTQTTPLRIVAPQNSSKVIIQTSNQNYVSYSGEKSVYRHLKFAENDTFGGYDISNGRDSVNVTAQYDFGLLKGGMAIIPSFQNDVVVSGVNGTVTANPSTNVYNIKDLTGCKSITGKILKTSGTAGIAFYDVNGTFITGLVNTTEDTGTVVTLDVPFGAKSVKWTYLSDGTFTGLVINREDESKTEVDNSDAIGRIDYQNGGKFVKTSFTNSIFNYGVISSQNKWYVSGKSFSHLIVNIGFAKCGKIKVTPSDNACMLAFLKSYSTPSNNDPVVFAGEETRYTIDSETIMDVPADCEYLYMVNQTGLDNMVPDKIELINRNYGFRKLDLSQYYKYVRCISPGGNYNDESVARACVMPTLGFNRIKIKAVNRVAIFARLESASNYFTVGGRADFINGDSNRFVIDSGQEVVLPVTDDFKVLYFTATSGTGEDLSPEIYVEDKTQAKDEKYRLILHEDFDDGISDIWKSIESPSPYYISKFFADENNWYADSSCMVLKLTERNSELVGPYISTANTLAIKSGKVRLRMKVTNTEDAFKWCFWLFGQNKEWPKATEIDLFEKTSDTRFKTTLHYTDTDNVDQDEILSYIRGSWFSTDWHILGIEFDSEKIVTYIDDMKVSETELSQFDMGDNGLVNPMDFRFNVKAIQGYSGADAMMLIDWIDIYTDEVQGTPLMGFVQEDIQMSVGEVINVNPSFLPSNAINRAFNLVSSDSDIVEVHQYLNDNDYNYVRRAIEAKSVGTAVLTMTSYKGGVTKQFNVTVTAF